MLKTAFIAIKGQQQGATVIGFGGLHLYSSDEPHAANGLELAQM